MKKNKTLRLYTSVVAAILTIFLVSCGGKTSNLKDIADDTHEPYSGEATLSFAINLDSDLSSQIQEGSAPVSDPSTRISGLSLSEGSSNANTYTNCDGQVQAFDIDKGLFVSLAIPVSIEGNNAKVYNVKPGETYSISLSCPVDGEKSLQLQSLASVPKDADSSEEIVSDISETTAYRMAAFNEAVDDLVTELEKIELSISQKMDEIAALLDDVSSTVTTFIAEQKLQFPDKEDLFIDPIVLLSETPDSDTFLDKVSQDLLSEESIITKLQESSDTVVSTLYIDSQTISKDQSLFLLRSLLPSIQFDSISNTALLDVFSDIIDQNKSVSIETLAEASTPSLYSDSSSFSLYAISATRTLLDQTYNTPSPIPSDINEDILKSVFSNEDSQTWTARSDEELSSLEITGAQAFIAFYSATMSAQLNTSDENIIAFSNKLRSIVFSSNTQSSAPSPGYFERFNFENTQYSFDVYDEDDNEVYRVSMKSIVTQESGTTYVNHYFLTKENNTISIGKVLSISAGPDYIATSTDEGEFSESLPLQDSSDFTPFLNLYRTGFVSDLSIDGANFSKALTLINDKGRLFYMPESGIIIGFDGSSNYEFNATSFDDLLSQYPELQNLDSLEVNSHQTYDITDNGLVLREESDEEEHENDSAIDESHEENLSDGYFERFNFENAQYSYETYTTGEDSQITKVTVKSIATEEAGTTYFNYYFAMQSLNNTITIINPFRFSITENSISIITDEGEFTESLPLPNTSVLTPFLDGHLQGFISNLSVDGTTFNKALKLINPWGQSFYMTESGIMIDTNSSFNYDFNSSSFDDLLNEYPELQSFEEFNNPKTYVITDNRLVLLEEIYGEFDSNVEEGHEEDAHSYASDLFNQPILALKYDESGQVTHEVKYDRFGFPTIYKSVYTNGQKVSSSLDPYSISSAYVAGAYDNKSPEDDVAINMNGQGFLTEYSHSYGNVTLKYSYNSQGLVEREEYYDNGELFSIEIYEYSENLKHIKTSSYYPEKNEQYVYIFSEDDKTATLRKSTIDVPSYEYSGEVISDGTTIETNFIMTNESEYRRGWQEVNEEEHENTSNGYFERFNFENAQYSIETYNEEDDEYEEMIVKTIVTEEAGTTYANIYFIQEESSSITIGKFLSLAITQDSISNITDDGEFTTSFPLTNSNERTPFLNYESVGFAKDIDFDGVTISKALKVIDKGNVDDGEEEEIEFIISESGKILSSEWTNIQFNSSGFDELLNQYPELQNFENLEAGNPEYYEITDNGLVLEEDEDEDEESNDNGSNQDSDENTEDSSSANTIGFEYSHDKTVYYEDIESIQFTKVVDGEIGGELLLDALETSKAFLLKALSPDSSITIEEIDAYFVYLKEYEISFTGKMSGPKGFMEFGHPYWGIRAVYETLSEALESQEFDVTVQAMLYGVSGGTETVASGMARIAYSNILYGLKYGYSQDTDGDSIVDNQDAFPNNAEEWADTDLDGIGDNSDTSPYQHSDYQEIALGSDEDIFKSLENNTFNSSDSSTGEISLEALLASEKFLELFGDESVDYTSLDISKHLELLSKTELYFTYLKSSLEFHSGNGFDSKAPKDFIKSGYEWSEVNIYSSVSEAFGSQDSGIVIQHILDGYTFQTSLVSDGLLEMAKNIVEYGKEFGYTTATP
ncbi:hypothetical protein DID78_06275 [Candidatus Marinamargulisbacteria bacterium SCGC AG-343-D04]|nr:hypothetical protein DID78_06275 [Candidatus Marinamargulisbacteria bacterium SCGC AG-343-D04]